MHLFWFNKFSMESEMAQHNITILLFHRGATNECNETKIIDNKKTK